MDNLLRLQDLIDNPTPRVPICLCLDTSGSMSSTVRYEGSSSVSAIDELNHGLRQFYEELKADEVALYAAEICIVTFGGNEPELIMDFANLERQSDLPTLQANGATPMGEAINLALDRLEQRKQEYRDKGVDYYQPWLVLMTDGENNGSSAEFERASARTVELINTKKLTIFPLAISSDDAYTEQQVMQTLRRFSPNRDPLKLGRTKFSQFFQWLSQSVARTSVSVPGEKVQLDLDGIKGWAEF